MSAHELMAHTSQYTTVTVHCGQLQRPGTHRQCSAPGKSIHSCLQYYQQTCSKSTSVTPGSKKTKNLHFKISTVSLPVTNRPQRFYTKYKVFFPGLLKSQIYHSYRSNISINKRQTTQRQTLIIIIKCKNQHHLSPKLKHQHFQLRTGRFCGRNVVTAHMPLLTATGAFRLARVLHSCVSCSLHNIHSRTTRRTSTMKQRLMEVQLKTELKQRE